MRRRQLLVAMTAFVAALAGIVAFGEIQAAVQAPPAGTIKILDADGKKGGTIEANGKSKQNKGWIQSTDSAKIRANPIKFNGQPDPRRSSVDGIAQDIVGTWNGTVTNVPYGRYELVVEITFQQVDNANVKQTIKASKRVFVP